MHAGANRIAANKSDKQSRPDLSHPLLETEEGTGCEHLKVQPTRVQLNLYPRVQNFRATGTNYNRGAHRLNEGCGLVATQRVGLIKMALPLVY